jgi:hypothetical protein
MRLCRATVLPRVRVGWAPVPKLLPYGCRLQPKHRADRHVGENPVGVIAKKPLLSLPCLALDLPSRRLVRSVNTRQSIFEHGPHQ